MPNSWVYLDDYLTQASSLPTSSHGPEQVRVKCNEDDTIGDLKKLVAAQTGELGMMGAGLNLRVSWRVAAL